MFAHLYCFSFFSLKFGLIRATTSFKKNCCSLKLLNGANVHFFFKSIGHS